MFDTVKNQITPIIASEKQVRFVFVEEAELIHVGGGSATAYF